MGWLDDTRKDPLGAALFRGGFLLVALVSASISHQCATEGPRLAGAVADSFGLREMVVSAGGREVPVDHVKARITLRPEGTVDVHPLAVELDATENCSTGRDWILVESVGRPDEQHVLNLRFEGAKDAVAIGSVLSAASCEQSGCAGLPSATPPDSTSSGNSLEMSLPVIETAEDPEQARRLPYLVTLCSKSAQKVTVSATVRSVPYTGTLDLDIQPGNAVVQVDGEALPARGQRSVRPGWHEVSARLDGYQSADMRLFVQRSNTVPVKLSLEKLVVPTGPLALRFSFASPYSVHEKTLSVVLFLSPAVAGAPSCELGGRELTAELEPTRWRLTTPEPVSLSDGMNELTATCVVNGGAASEDAGTNPSADGGAGTTRLTAKGRVNFVEAPVELASTEFKLRVLGPEPSAMRDEFAVKLLPELEACRELHKKRFGGRTAEGEIRCDIYTSRRAYLLASFPERTAGVYDSALQRFTLYYDSSTPIHCDEDRTTRSGRVFIHELHHRVEDEMSGYRGGLDPARWASEGSARWIEPGTTSKEFAAAWSKVGGLRLRELDPANFYATDQLWERYEAAAFAVDCLIRKHGLDSWKRFVEVSGEGNDDEAALTAAFGIGYEGVQQEVNECARRAGRSAF